MTVQETYDKWPEGTLFESDTRDYFVKPEQNETFHTEGMLVNIFTGKLIHFSHFKELTPRYGHEIMW